MSALTHLQHLQSQTKQSGEGKLARAVFYFLSLQNMSKRISVTGEKKEKKDFFLLETGAKI